MSDGMDVLSGVTVQSIQLDSRPALGAHLSPRAAPLLLVANSKGYVRCGYFNIDTASRPGDLAGQVTGVATLKELLDAQPSRVSEAPDVTSGGMTVRAYLNCLMREGTDG